MRFSHLGPFHLWTVSSGNSLYLLLTAPDRGTAPPPQLEHTRRRRRAGHGQRKGRRGV